MALATQAQVRFIRTLLEDRDTPTNYASWVETLEGRIMGDRLTKLDASKSIDFIKGHFPRKIVEKAKSTWVAVTHDGMYRDPATGEIFKVQVAVHGSGNLYAKKLVLEQLEDGTWKVRFEYAPGALRNLHAEWRMTLAEAKEFGALYGTCIRCGRTLTNEKSIEQAMGPVCSGRQHWREDDTHVNHFQAAINSEWGVEK